LDCTPSKLGAKQMNMLKMLWSGLCYFLNGARRHEVLLGELSEHCVSRASFRRAGLIKHAERSI
ncbi:MAG: hypothetical protein UHN47_17480, partial [Lachnospiraceae bacterium]|nr:hypothetical protein [Lachnospiraceae bacterium]